MSSPLRNSFFLPCVCLHMNCVLNTAFSRCSGNKEKDPCDWILFYDSKDTTEDVLGKDCSDYCHTSKSGMNVHMPMPNTTTGNTTSTNASGTSSNAPSRRMQMRKTVNIFFDPPLCEIDSKEGNEIEVSESGESGSRRRKRFRFKHGPDERGGVVTALLAGLQQLQDSMLQTVGSSMGDSGASVGTSRSGSAEVVSAVETGSSIGFEGSSPAKRNRPSPDA